MKKTLILISVITLVCSNLFAQTDFDIGGHWFFNYKAGKSKALDVNAFDVTRGYLNIKKDLGEGFSVRVTPDITLDEEGKDQGNVELRLKYAYLKYKFEDFGFFTKPEIEVGVVHRPYFGFEQKINVYRVQGKMFLDRYKVIGTTDYGATFSALLGGEINKEYQKEVSKAYPGKFGSFSIGIYNGGGYHAIEANKNKTIETRITVRPLYSVIPNLQLSYFGAFGKGNLESMPDLAVHAAVATFEHKMFTIIGQYYTGTGNDQGKAIENGESIDQNGYSLYAELKLVPKKFAIYGRYDFMKEEYASENEKKGFIVGAGYTLKKGIKILADFDAISKNEAVYDDNSLFKLSMEVKF